MSSFRILCLLILLLLGTDIGAMGKKGGGVRQRLKASEDSKKESTVATYLLQQWAWGAMSPQQVQHIMSLLLTDIRNGASNTLSFNLINSLAAIGSHGLMKNNMLRDLLGKLPVCHMPWPYRFRCPLKHSRSMLGVHYQSIDMLLPHELFNALYHHYPAAFRDKLVGSPGALQNCWKDMDGSPRYAAHPVRTRGNHNTHCIPISFHGDGTPTVGSGKVWGKSVNVFGWSSLLAHGSTESVYFMSFCIYEAIQTAGGHGHTLNSFFRRLAWSPEWLYKGVWPESDINGKMYDRDSPEWSRPIGKKPGDPLAGGYYCCLWIILGDLDYFTKVLGLANYNSNCPCSLCPVDSGGLPWYDFRPAAPWLHKVFTAGEGNLTNILFTLPGVTVESIYPDWMHVKHLGLDKKAYGSTLYALIHFVLPGEPADNLRKVFSEIHDVYRKRGVKNRYSQMKLSMFFSKKGIALKGKAQEVKDLGPVLLEIWEKHFNKTIKIHRQVRLILDLSVCLENIIDDMQGWRPTPLQSEALIETAHAYLNVLQSANDHFKSDDAGPVELFHVTIKGHFLLHICYLAKFLNPSVAWCYRGEDFMGKIRPLAASCAKRAQPWEVTNKIISKYRHALQYTLRPA